MQDMHRNTKCICNIGDGHKPKTQSRWFVWIIYPGYTIALPPKMFFWSTLPKTAEKGAIFLLLLDTCTKYSDVALLSFSGDIYTVPSASSAAVNS